MQHYHGDNGIFTEDMFRKDCEKGVNLNFFDAGAHHHNAHMEYAIQSIMYMQCTFMVHKFLHWDDHGVGDILFWYFTTKHASWTNNRVPSRQSS